jgi:hypothetical protein
MPATLTRRHMEPLEQAGSRYAELMRLGSVTRNSGKTGGGSVVFASLTRLPLILWRDGSTG